MALEKSGCTTSTRSDRPPRKGDLTLVLLPEALTVVASVRRTLGCVLTFGVTDVFIAYDGVSMIMTCKVNYAAVQITSEVHSYNLGSSTFHMQLPKPKTNSLREAFAYQGAMAWNALPNRAWETTITGAPNLHVSRP